MEIRAMTTEEAREAILKHWGGYQEYRRAIMAEPIQKSEGAQQDFVAACEGVAKVAGQNLQEYFAANPASYVTYRELSYARGRKA